MSFIAGLGGEGQGCLLTYSVKITGVGLGRAWDGDWRNRMNRRPSSAKGFVDCKSGEPPPRPLQPAGLCADLCSRHSNVGDYKGQGEGLSEKESGREGSAPRRLPGNHKGREDQARRPIISAITPPPQ